MTPAEFSLYIEGYNWREECTWFRTAWQTVLIVNHWRKKEDQLTIDDVLPEHKQEQKAKEPMTDEQMAQNALAWALTLGAEDKRANKGVL
jgi:hypothetical protein